MTVAEIIAALQQQPQDAIVKIGFTVYDGDWSEEEESAVASVYEHGGEVIISE